MIKTIVLDDEKKGRKLLITVLHKYCDEVEVVGHAETAHQAYEVINSTNPDLIFLDIEMPNGTGLDLLKMVDTIPFHVVFTTVYDQYAIKAIKYSALDYLLKPIDIDELHASVEKVSNEMSKSNETKNENIDILLSAL